jgi:hypothetical protein
MQTYRCECGKLVSWGSMPPPRCMGCKTCGTAMTLHPDLLGPPEAHEFFEMKVETDDGDAALTLCRWCHKTKKQIEAGGNE